MEGCMTDKAPIEIYEADGLSLIIPITFEAGSGISSILGGTAEVHVRSRNDVAIEGVATVTGAAEVTAVFAPYALPAANYSLQARAAPPATALQTVLDDDLIVHRSLRPPV
jgi:hypothetical protein